MKPTVPDRKTFSELATTPCRGLSLSRQATRSVRDMERIQYTEGDFKDFNVRCPWHNSCFDVRTGKVTNGRAKVDLKTFEVEMRDGRICVDVQPRTEGSS